MTTLGGSESDSMFEGSAGSSATAASEGSAGEASLVVLASLLSGNPSAEFTSFC